MASPNALKLDAMSLIFAASVNDDELTSDLIARNDPERITRAVAAVGVLLAGDGKQRKTVVDWISLLGDKLEENKAA